MSIVTGLVSDEYPFDLKTKKLKEEMRGVMTRMRPGGMVNTQQLPPFITVGQTELLGRETKLFATIAVVISVLAVVVSSLLALSALKDNQRQGSSVVDELRRIRLAVESEGQQERIELARLRESVARVQEAIELRPAR